MPSMNSLWNYVDRHARDLTHISDAIWDVPELNYTETHACALHTETLQHHHFRTQTHIANLPTAIMGESGTNGPIIAFLGEYDALPNLSNSANTPHPSPLPGQETGHGCGHNLLGSASLLAAIAVKDWLDDSGHPGRVRYYGCPAEEGGAGKSFMIRGGAFDDVDAAISWHPAAFAGVFPPSSLANVVMDFIFHGKASHAAASPFLGRSALDAAELMNIGVNYLREHILPSSRIHYAYLDAGGKAPNIVQAHTKIRYIIRAQELDDLFDLIRRVRNIAEGASLMTETTQEDHIISGMANLVPCPPLEEIMHHHFEELGPPEFDEADYQLAHAFRKSFTPEDIVSAFRNLGLSPQTDMALCERILPRPNNPSPFLSTDVGDVSWIVPTIQALGATSAIGTQLHSWQMTAQGKSSIAHKGMVHVAKIMASTAVSLLTNPTLLERAQHDHAERLKGRLYTSPIPAETPPPFPTRTT